MDFTNHTSFHAHLFRTTVSETRMALAVFTRITYEIRNGTLAVAAEQAWPVSPGPYEFEYGPMDGDDVYKRGGVDLIVFGKARPPGGREVTQLDVHVELGTHRYRLLVIGDRVWQRQQGKLVASAPKPFREIPLTLEHAYGGKDVWDEAEFPFPANPVGKGYAYEEASAEGKPLPNLEDPDRPVRAWADQPDPVGVAVCPMACVPRLKNSLIIGPGMTGIKRIMPTLFNSAFPPMIAPRAVPGDVLTITGVSAAGPLSIRLPPVPVKTRLRLGEQVTEAPLFIDQVGVEPDRQRAFVSYRYHQNYEVVPLQKRSCELLAAQ